MLDELDRSWSEIQALAARSCCATAPTSWSPRRCWCFPGLEELVALRAMREVEALGEFDVCVVDCAPTGSTLRMLRFPDALRLFMEDFFDIKRRAARAVRPLLETRRAPAGWCAGTTSSTRSSGSTATSRTSARSCSTTTRTSARLVVNAARVVVDETRRSFAYLSLYGVATDAVLVNRVLPRGGHGRLLRAVGRRASSASSRRSRAVPACRCCARRCARPSRSAWRRCARSRARSTASAIRRRASPRPPDPRSRSAARARCSRSTCRTSRQEEIDVTALGDELLVRVRDAQRAHRAAGVAGRPRRRRGAARGGRARDRVRRDEAGADAAAARIVSLVPSLTEALFALGSRRSRGRRHRWCVHPAEAVATLPKVGGTKDADVDARSSRSRPIS